MKFKRLTIRNYRGVEERTVEFADSGATLIQGPNEIGKTSLAEAVHILFQFKASSNHQTVREIKPVHRDVGTEIELEAESGPYHFIYRKRFHKDKATELTLVKPVQDNLTDDEAHERANRILTETLDKELWDALIVRQGDMIEQPELSGQAALMKALDSASGGEGSDRRAESLFERVEAEYVRYYQRNGREGSALTGAAAAFAAAREKAEETKSLLDSLEKKSERCALLKRREVEVREQRRIKASEHARQLLLVKRIDELERELASARLTRETAGRELLARERDGEDRERLRAAVHDAGAEVQRLEVELADNEPSLQEAAKRLAASRTRAAEAEERKRDAEAALALGRRDAEYLDNVLDLEMMRERLDRVNQARAKKQAALRELADNRIDEALLKRITESELEMERLRARLETESPRVVVHALSDVRMGVDGGERRLAAGDMTQSAVSGTMRLTVPGRVDIEIHAGGGLEKISRQLDEAAARQGELFRQAGVCDSSEAMAAFERRRGAKADIESAARIEKDTLRDLAYENFCARIAALEEAVSGYAAGRDGGRPLPLDLDAARECLPGLETVLSDASLSLSLELEACAVLEKDWERLEMARRTARIALSLSEKGLEQARTALSHSRGRMEDKAIEEGLAAAGRAAADAEESVRLIGERLRGHNPDKIRALASALTGSLESLDTQLHDTQRELAGLETELSIRGEEGLFERWQGAVVEVGEFGGRLESLRSRARAAKLLYEAMGEERERARRAYLQPLKEKIEELGRVVWDSSFSVHMNEADLSIESRTLDGVTVPFGSLSGGAREQLALIFRAACAILVSRHEGMPLILDDALGYTDAERLDLMGAVLARAAQECQVIILTCVPSRYSTIGPARVIQLP